MSIINKYAIHDLENIYSSGIKRSCWFQDDADTELYKKTAHVNLRQSNSDFNSVG